MMNVPALDDLGTIFRRSAALQAGVSAYDLRRLIELGQVRQIGRGVYSRPTGLADGQPWAILREEHLRRCEEQVAIHPGHVLSHQSAGVLHGLQLRLHPAMDVHLTSVDRAPCSRRASGLQLHHADSVVNATQLIRGVRATTIDRTLADILRTSRLPNGVAALDAAVRDGLTTARRVRAVLDTQTRWKGRPRACQALSLHDATRESWLESFSFVALHEFGVPIPTPQVEVLDEGFHLVGRVDGLLGSVFLEADGASKYYFLCDELGLTPDESLARTQAAQEDRHRRLVRLGLHGVRWTTREVTRHPEVVAGRIHQALAAATPDRFRGWFRTQGQIVRPELLTPQTSP